MKITSHIPNATLEAIYWWNRTEGYYHEYFCRLDGLEKERGGAFDFFVTKVFQVFLTEYSVRRNIASGEGSVRDFVETLIDSGFYRQIVEGDLNAIDRYSDEFRNNNSLTNRRQTRSLLSKVAFLINPSKFALMDSYAKNSLWLLVKDDRRIKRRELECYVGFVSQVERYIEENPETFNVADSLLMEFSETAAFTFFSTNRAAFERRVFDKMLWLNIASSNGKIIDNSGYRAFLSYSAKHHERS